MKKIFLISACIVLILGLGAVIFAQMDYGTTTEKYGAKLGSFSYIQAFFAPDNKVGFFDNRDGKIYIYDTESNSCVKILQVNQLGNPLLRVR
ncbi:MAG: hypothetical protein PHU91_02455 [Candidatus Omnitrophica bacterium]|nr:hypothetical protein [Candidatus Omnitrophota bacterium]MDD5236514.1 hypothetical protein [Candidatus Omnitrophota bacterium]MDD5611102.1 hypothetical protein [Candidatus Omnitrophota bacterium]